MTFKTFRLLPFVVALLSGCGGGGSTTDPAAVSSGAPATPVAVLAPLATQPALPAINTVDLLTLPSSPVSFVQRVVKSDMSYSYGFVVHDFDDDKLPDIAFFDSYAGGRAEFKVGEGATGYVQWGSGGLEQIVEDDTFPEAVQPPQKETLFERQIAVDINGDGWVDIVGVVNSHSAVVAYLNPGAHGLPWTRRYLTLDTPGPINLAAGDVDGDGRPDIVVAMRNQPSTNPDPAVRGLVWLRNPGPGGGAWIQNSIEGTEALVEPRTVQVADFDGDGRPDVAVADAVKGVVSWFKRLDSGAWTGHVIPGALSIHGHFGTAVDLDGDGRTDLVQPVYQGITWLRNIDGGTTWEAIPIGSFKSEADQIIVSEVAVGDIDRDGKLDVAFVISTPAPLPTSPRRGGLYWLRQGASVRAWDTFTIQFDDNATVGVALADLDGDGDLDIVTNTEYLSNAVAVWRNDLVKTGQ